METTCEGETPARQHGGRQSNWWRGRPSAWCFESPSSETSKCGTSDVARRGWNIFDATPQGSRNSSLSAPVKSSVKLGNGLRTCAAPASCCQTDVAALEAEVQTASSTASSIAERQLAVVPAEAVPSRHIDPAQPPHLRTDETPLRIAVLESKVAALELHVEELQRQLNNVIGHDSA